MKTAEQYGVLHRDDTYGDLVDRAPDCGTAELWLRYGGELVCREVTYGDWKPVEDSDLGLRAKT